MVGMTHVLFSHFHNFYRLSFLNYVVWLSELRKMFTLYSLRNILCDCIVQHFLWYQFHDELMNNANRSNIKKSFKEKFKLKCTNEKIFLISFLFLFFNQQFRKVNFYSSKIWILINPSWNNRLADEAVSE